jgi:hypothetical protein
MDLVEGGVVGKFSNFMKEVESSLQVQSLVGAKKVSLKKF